MATFAIGDVLASCASAAPGSSSATLMPPPETKTIRLQFNPCDAPLMISEPYLREEGFTHVTFTDTIPGLDTLVNGEADIAVPGVGSLAGVVDSGGRFVGIGPVHPGCAQIWAPQRLASLNDARGHTVVVNSKAPNFLPNWFIPIALKNAGIDPSEVNFVVQPDADLTQLFLAGKSDLLVLADINAMAFQEDPANTGHVVLDQTMDAPWSQEDCCVIGTTRDWLQANPIAAKRVLRAIYRAADSLPKDRADATKVATNKGLFGGQQNLALVRSAANMVPYDWRNYDIAESMRFHAGLMNSVGLIKLTADEAVTKAIDVHVVNELVTGLKR